MRRDFVLGEFFGKELSGCAIEIIVLGGSNRLGNIGFDNGGSNKGDGAFAEWFGQRGKWRFVVR